MKKPGKKISIMMLIFILLVGLAFIIFSDEKFDHYLQLVDRVEWPLLIIMGGVALKSLLPYILELLKKGQ